MIYWAIKIDDNKYTIAYLQKHTCFHSHIHTHIHTNNQTKTHTHTQTHTQQQQTHTLETNISTLYLSVKGKQ